MSIEGHNELLPAIEAVLREADKPLTCHEIYEKFEVRSLAPSVNRVSDYLSVLFRRGRVSRVRAPETGGNQRTRWAYAWKDKELPEWAGPDPVGYRPKTLVDKPGVLVTDDGDFIRIDLPNFTITVKRNKG